MGTKKATIEYICRQCERYQKVIVDMQKIITKLKEAFWKLQARNNKYKTALRQIAERRILITDDENETEADAMVKIAKQALQEKGKNGGSSGDLND